MMGVALMDTPGGKQSHLAHPNVMKWAWRDIDPSEGVNTDLAAKQMPAEFFVLPALQAQRERLGTKAN